MNEATLAFLGIASGIINMLGLVPYLRDILRKKTKPERASWWVWLLLGVVALGGQLAAGARWSLALTITSVVAMAVIAVLSIPYGYGTFHKRDLYSIVFAVVGVIVSLLLHNPAIAIFMVIAIDAVGMWLTIKKTWAAPYTETLSAWVLATIAAVLTVGAVGEYTVARTAYPVYAVVGQGLLLATIITRRRVVVAGVLTK